MDWQYIETKQDWAPAIFHRIKFVDLLCPFTCRTQLWLFPRLQGTMVRIIPSPIVVEGNSRAVTCLLWLVLFMLISRSLGFNTVKGNHCSGRLWKGRFGNQKLWNSMEHSSIFRSIFPKARLGLFRPSHFRLWEVLQIPLYKCQCPQMILMGSLQKPQPYLQFSCLVIE